MTLADRIDHRWMIRWHSPMILYCKQRGLPAEALAILCAAHSERFRQLLAAYISQPTIARLDLDDPRLSDAQFSAQLLAAIERRRTRLHSQQRAIQRRITHAPSTRNSTQ